MENVNEEKRAKFFEYAGKRVNNVLHDIQILEPMARSNNYDFTKNDVEEMFMAMQQALNDAKVEFDKKFEEKARTMKKVFTFGQTAPVTQTGENVVVTESAPVFTNEIIPNEVEETIIDEQINEEFESIIEEDIENGTL